MMGVPQKALAHIEIGDYLALEDASQTRHEYLDGVIYAIQGEAVQGMAGGSAAHADVTRNAGHALEAEHANLVLAEDAVTGLKQALSGQFVSDDELDQALGVMPAQ